MDNKKIPFHFPVDSEHIITLYKNGNNKNIYYYFKYEKNYYQGTTGTDDLDKSIEKSKDYFYDVKKGLREKGVKRIKFEKLVKEFLKQKEKEVSSRTIHDYKKSSEYLIERFRNKDIEKICDRDEYSKYQDWRKDYYETHKSKQRQINYNRDGEKIVGRKLKHVGPVVINHELRLLVSILRYGKEFKKLFKSIEIPRYKDLDEPRREEILTTKEYLKLRNYWMKKKPYYGHIISFLYNTGIRYSSELNKIQWRDVNLEKSYVIIRNRKSKSDPITTSVPLMETAKKDIEYLKSREGISKKPDDFVFVDDNGRQIKRISRSFKNSLKECGINKDIVMYSFRHMFTTRIVQRPDIPLTDLSYILGHKNTNTLQEHYTHLNPTRIVNTFLESEQNIKQKFRKKILKRQTESSSKTTT